MGAWGAGLYSSDMAMDLKSTIGAVARLPFDEPRLVEILRETHREVADDPTDEEHTVFWLVLADQFEKRAIASAEVRVKALAIIADGSDLRVQKELGLSGADLRKRTAVLDDLQRRILAGPETSKPRKVLRAPQPYVLEEGGIYIYPTLRGQSINPYMGGRMFDRASWQPDGYGAMLIAERGRAFDYLAWYQPLVAAAGSRSRPNIAGLSREARWVVAEPGTLTAAHYKRMELERLDTIALSKSKVAAVLGERRPIIACAVADISLSNAMTVGLSVPGLKGITAASSTRTVLEGLGGLQD